MQDSAVAEDRQDNVRSKRNRLSTGGSTFALLQAGAGAQLPRGCKFKAKFKDKLDLNKDIDLGEVDEADCELSFTHSRQKRSSFLQNLFLFGGGGGGKAERPKRHHKRPPRPPPPPLSAPSPPVRLPRMPPKVQGRQRSSKVTDPQRPHKMQKFSELMLMRKAIAGGMAADEEVRNLVATAVAAAAVAKSAEERPPPLHRNVVNPKNPFLRKKKPPPPRHGVFDSWLCRRQNGPKDF